MIATLFGCASKDMFDPTIRTNQYRQDYPPVITSRSDVRGKLKTKPVYSEQRPSMGWQSHANSYLVQKTQKIESSQGRQIFSIEKYILPDSRSSLDFLSLCQLWFYYDMDEKVVDVEWLYQSD